MAQHAATRALLGAGALILVMLTGCDQGGIGEFFVQNYCDLDCPYGYRTDAVGTPFCACAEQECIDRPPTRTYRPGTDEPPPGLAQECYEVCDCNFFGFCDCYDECYDYGYYEDDCEWAETEEEYSECIGGGAPLPPEDNPDGEPPDIDWADGQCVAFESECDIPDGYIPCPGCNFQGRNLQPGDIAEISGARWLCQDNGQVTMLPPLTNPEPDPIPEPEPASCSFDGQMVNPGTFVNPLYTCEVCVCGTDGVVSCDAASCYVCDEENGGYPPGTVLDVYGVACVCDASGIGVCGQDCLYQGVHVPNGSQVNTDDCGTCTCGAGQLACEGCNEPEPEPEGEPEPTVEPEGPVCAAPVFCDAPAPACAADEIPSVVDGCYGDCVYWSDCVEVDFGCYPPPSEDFCTTAPPACGQNEVVTYRADCYGPCVPEEYCP